MRHATALHFDLALAHWSKPSFLPNMDSTALEDLGYSLCLEEFRTKNGLESFEVGRVTSEHKDRYTVKTVDGELDAEIIGNLRFSAASRRDLPAVGDWVALMAYDEDKALIHAVLPRTSVLERRAAGQSGQSQIIATNIDVGLIVQSVNRDFSVNRLERYTAICKASGIEPVIALSKVDLADEHQLLEMQREVGERLKGIRVFAVSNESQQGIPELTSIFQRGKTYCLLGSSGVGKSTLINSITGKNTMETGAISERIDRGKHVTTHRELIVFDRGILIDNPGMREVGITSSEAGLELTFDEIAALSRACKFTDCSHSDEVGCAVLEALESGELDPDAFANFQRMEKERSHFESSAMERKQKDKDLGKLIKQVKKRRGLDKY